MAASRFAFPTEWSMRIMDKDSLLAFFNVVDTETGLEYKDWQLREGTNGVWAASPNREYEVDGEKRYSKYVQPAWDPAAGEDGAMDEYGVAWVEELADAALAEYERRKAEGETAPKKKSRKRGSKKSGGRRKGQKRGKSSRRASGRGPVRAPTVDEDDDEEDDLPW